MKRHACDVKADNESAMTCKKCGEAFHDPKKLKQHARLCDKDGSTTVTSKVTAVTLKCMMCEMVFDSAEELRRHGQERHQFERDFHCSSCPATYRYLYKARPF